MIEADLYKELGALTKDKDRTDGKRVFPMFRLFSPMIP